MAGGPTLGASPPEGPQARRTRSAALNSAVAGFVLALIGALTALATPEAPAVAADVCLGSTGPAALTNMFSSEPGGIIAADYQRAVPLPDGRTLWLFQDATIRLPEPEPDPNPPDPPDPTDPPVEPPPTERLLHNIGMIQSGSCFTVLRSGTDADPRAWLLPSQTNPFVHWFWPLGAEMGSDGQLYIYLAEVFERGGLYLSATEPVGTRIVAINVASLAVTGTYIPPGSSAQLYGFSITSDNEWTYLYGHCHRQFGWDIGPFGVPAHDFDCSGNVPVARVPKGQLFDTPTYWNGSTWQSDPNQAVNVMPAGRLINPSQVRRHNDEFIAVSKVDDWFGTTIYLDRAPAASGPWTNYARIAAPQTCDPVICNSYFASWVPGTVDGKLIIGLSHNRWDGQLSAVNRPTYLLAPPPGSHAFALRCSKVDC